MSEQGGNEKRKADLAAMIVAALCVLAAAAGQIKAGYDKTHRADLARMEQERLDRAGVIGWVRLDQETKQLYFVRR